MSTDTAPPSSPDLDVLRERYRQERERRDGAARRYTSMQFSEDTVPLDPYADVQPREALTDHVDVLIVGGGFGGLLTAARMRQAGVERVRIVEVASDVGGCWYWNRYPGAACDVESYIYLPLLEETGYMPVERYSKAAEIREHSRRIARHFNLYEDAVFSTQVTALDWDEAAGCWVVRTNRGDRMTARFVVLTTGPLNRPKLPDIPGVETFQGHSFHTSRWDYAYTGGSESEPMTGLAGKRVGVIGTGATAVQCVPPLGRAAEHLFVFQRTPSSVDARNNTPTDPEWAASLKPGWQQERIESFTRQLAGDLACEDLVADGWTVLAKAMREKVALDPSLTADPDALLETADLEKMVQIRERIETIVEDPATAEALKPWFSLFCKRPCFHDEYLQTFNRPNVTLVDTQGRGVERITERGVVVAGEEYPLDCLIFATGFDVSGDYSRKAGFQIRGAGGRTLSKKWSEGVSTLHGMHVNGFPNCFILSQIQAGMSANFPHMINEQAAHAAHVVAACQARGASAVEATAEAEAAWVDMILAQSESRRQFLEACTPGYYNNEGRLSDAAARGASLGAGPMAFVQLLNDWRAAGDFAGLTFDGQAAAPEAAQ